MAGLFESRATVASVDGDHGDKKHRTRSAKKTRGLVVTEDVRRDLVDHIILAGSFFSCVFVFFSLWEIP